MEGKWRRNRGKKIRERKAWKTNGGGIEKNRKCRKEKKSMEYKSLLVVINLRVWKKKERKG